MHGTDVCTLLKGDLVKVRELTERLEHEPDAAERLRLVGALRHEMELHSRLEEEVLFPAIRDALDARTRNGVVRRARKEHQRTLRTLGKVAAADPDTHRFQEALQVLKERIRTHEETEDQRVFQKIRDGMDTESMQKVGERLNRRRLEVEHLYKGRATVAREASEP